jgi:alkylation response protein AidB-like acyl-CoA dehydrogenase
MTDTATTLTDAEAEAFRQRCVEFLEEHATAGSSRRSTESVERGKQFLAAAAEAGLAGIPYPTEYGGAGLTLAHEKIWRAAKAWPACRRKPSSTATSG